MLDFPILHTYTDGSRLMTISAKYLVGIPVWKNNRNIDHGHVQKIQQEIGEDVQRLDRGYVVALIHEADAGGAEVEQAYIVDGQHRASVLRRHFAENLCVPDFTVTVTVKSVASEAELIEFFNVINNIKPIQQWIDRPMILNNYVLALEQTFNRKKRVFIRPGKTVRPYMSSDTLREALEKHFEDLPKSEAGVRAFVERVAAWNEACVKDKDVVALGISNKKKADLFEKGAALGFVLGYDEGMPWIRRCLA